jgi:hypothetical protein
MKNKSSLWLQKNKMKTGVEAVQNQIGFANNRDTNKLWEIHDNWSKNEKLREIQVKLKQLKSSLATSRRKFATLS